MQEFQNVVGRHDDVEKHALVTTVAVTTTETMLDDGVAVAVVSTAT